MRRKRNMEAYELDLEIADEQLSGQSSFVIDDDGKAEWALKKIAVARAEVERMKMIVDNAKREYDKKLFNFTMKNDTSFLEGALAHYFSGVERKKTKTTESYALPSGRLILKKGGDDYVRDDTKLLAWLKENKPDKIKEEVKWGDLKREFVVSGANAIDENGEAIPGIVVGKKPDEFKVEV